MYETFALIILRFYIDWIELTEWPCYKRLEMNEDPMSMQPNETTAAGYSRRIFIKRALLGAAAMTAATLAAGRLFMGKTNSSQLPGTGSIFEPRPQDLQRHWGQKLSRFRLR